MKPLLALAAATLIAAGANAAAPLNVKELMTKVVEPTSNAVFYVSSEPPKSDEQWRVLQKHASDLAKAAQSLKLAPQAKDKQWQSDLKLLLDSTAIADRAAKAKDQKALEDLNDPLYTACTTCHEHYLPKR